MTVDLTGVEVVVLDVDGTLVDSSFVHAVCWSDAFAELCVPRPTADLHRLVGVSADRLIESALADTPPAKQLREALKRRHGELYREHWPALRPLPGARELLRYLSARGLRTVLASSATEDELTALRKALDADQWIDAVTTADDGRGKPAPDLVQQALDGRAPARALMVGDTVWDAEAARRADVRFVAVTCGGTSEADLRAAGAEAVFADPAFLLAHVT